MTNFASMVLVAVFHVDLHPDMASSLLGVKQKHLLDAFRRDEPYSVFGTCTPVEVGLLGCDGEFGDLFESVGSAL